MKCIKLILILIVGMIILNSCCQKKKCYGVDHINAIELYHFEESDLDSSMIVTYEKNSDFCTSIDTFKMLEYNYHEWDSSSILFMNEILNPILDYKVILPRINQSYELTEFVLEELECNNCFPIGHDYFTSLESYKINGQMKINTGMYLKIDKSTDQSKL